MNPFVLFWRAGRDLFDDLFLMIGVNLLWLVIAGPLLGGAIYLTLNGFTGAAAVVALLSVIPLGPASAGLLTIAQKSAEGRVSSIGDFFRGMREHYRLSWLIYGLWMVGLVTLLFNLSFYLQVGAIWGVALSALFVYLTLAWFSLLIYLGPLMLIQEQKRLRLLWRNALIMAFGRPFFTLLTLLLMGIILVLSFFVVILPLLMTFAFLTLLGTRSTLALIQADEERRRAREEQEASGDQANTARGRRGQIKPRD